MENSPSPAVLSQINEKDSQFFHHNIDDSTFPSSNVLSSSSDNIIEKVLVDDQSESDTTFVIEKGNDTIGEVDEKENISHRSSLSSNTNAFAIGESGNSETEQSKNLHIPSLLSYTTAFSIHWIRSKIKRLMVQRRNELILFFALLFSFLSTFFQASGSIKGKLQLRKQPLPRRFFSSTSPVRDLYNGNGAAIHELLAHGEAVFVMYYAPWSTRCRDAKFHFDHLSRNFGDSVTFLAVNCWDPGGKCRRTYKMYTYPVFLLYVRSVSLRGIYYNHVVSADYMYKFLTNALNPLRRFNDISEAYQYFARAETVYVVGYFDLAQKTGRKHFDLYYDTALQALETDPARDYVQFAVVNNYHVARHFNLTNNGMIRAFHWSLTENLFYYSNLSIYDSHDVLKWIFELKPRKTQWYQPRSTKDEKLYEILSAGPTILLFTPRRPLMNVNEYQALFAETALKYWDCNRSRWTKYFLSLMHRYQKQSFDEWRGLYTKDCRNHKKTDPSNISALISSCCNEVVVSDSYLNYRNVCSLCSSPFHHSSVHNSKYENTKSTTSYVCPKYSSRHSGSSEQNTCNQNAVHISSIVSRSFAHHSDEKFCDFVKKCMGLQNFVNHCCKYTNRESSNFCPLFDALDYASNNNNKNDGFARFDGSSGSGNEFAKCGFAGKFASIVPPPSKQCQQLRLAEILKYPPPPALSREFPSSENSYHRHYSEEDPHQSADDRKIRGLSCATNKTLTFLALDTDHYGFLRDNLKIPSLATDRSAASVIIVDKQAESVFAMPLFSTKHLTSKTLNIFIHDFTLNHLNRHIKSEQSMWTSNVSPHLDRFIINSSSSSNDNIVGGEFRIRIQQITASTFNRTVLNSKKDVVLLYITRWCGFCQQIFHVFQTTAYYFRSLSHKLLFATIDADRNDLPWQYTADAYPAILFFPQNNKNESMLYPRRLPFTLPNLVSFVLSQCNWRSRLEFAFATCSWRCLTQNRRRIVFNLKRLQRYLFRLRKLAQDKAYLWQWVEDDPDYGPFIPSYMKQIWKKIAETNVKIRTLNLLLRFIMKNERNFNNNDRGNNKFSNPLYSFASAVIQEEDTNVKNLMQVLKNNDFINAQR